MYSSSCTGCFAWLLLLVLAFREPKLAIVLFAAFWLLKTLLGPELERLGRRRRLEKTRRFLELLASMVAKTAKADGRVTQEEIAAAEAHFRRYVSSGEELKICIAAFRAAKDSVRSIEDYAGEFSSLGVPYSMRMVAYDMLWDVASADGGLRREELDVLRSVAAPLGLPQFMFDIQFARRSGSTGAYGGDFGGGDFGGWDRGGASYSPDADCAVLGCRGDADDDEIKSAYRRLVKENHPDRLQAAGATKEMIDRATRKMAEINAAYERIKKHRGF